MKLYEPSKETAELKAQNLELFDQILEQKKSLFKLLRLEAASLGSEIEELQKEQRELAILNARQSLKVCMSGAGE